MKALAISLAIAAFAVASPAMAQTSPASGSGNVCLRSELIDHTRTPNDKTILFYMRDGKVWESDLRGSCPELTFNGFAYVATPPDEICGRFQSIRVIRTGFVCMLGPFVPYVAPPKT
jgi:hypothetical protein